MLRDDFMFQVEKEKYTSDSTIRNSLIDFVKTQYTNHPARVVEEFSICSGNARIDMAVINGAMHGYEIKSDIDSLQRLVQQTHYYNSVFDQVTLVVGASHLHEAFNMVPDWWGVMVARVNDNNQVYFNTIRESQNNECVELKEIAYLLWKNEALDVLNSVGINRGFKSKNHHQICEKLSKELDRTALSKFVRDYLFSRQDWKVAA